jgi:hypothetical protein
MVKFNKSNLEVMELLAKHMNSYQSVTWLATPREELGNKNPYEMIKQSRVNKVLALLRKDLSSIKKKKNTRS